MIVALQTLRCLLGDKGGVSFLQTLRFALRDNGEMRDKSLSKEFSPKVIQIWRAIVSLHSLPILGIDRSVLRIHGCNIADFESASVPKKLVCSGIVGGS